MDCDMTRRAFVKTSVLGTGGAALALCSGAGQSARGDSAAVPATPASQDALPKGKIGSLEVSRLLLGGNLLTHFTHARDLRYTYNLAKHYNTEEKILQTMALAEAHGINTLVIHTAPNVMNFLKRYRNERGGKMQWIVCPTAPIEPGLEAYAKQVQEIVDDGVDAIYLWGVRSDALVSQDKMDLVAQAVELAKAQGVPSGVGAHQLEVIAACEKHRVAADFYIKTLHHHNYPSYKLNYDSCWCSNPEETIELMKSVEKPWIAFKVMAAGAIPPQDAFRYVLENGADFVLAGMFDFEIAEDVAIAKQTLAQLGTRSRPWRA